MALLSPDDQVSDEAACLPVLRSMSCRSLRQVQTPFQDCLSEQHRFREENMELATLGIYKGWHLPATILNFLCYSFICDS